MGKSEVNEILAWLAFVENIDEGWPETNHRGDFWEELLMSVQA